MRRHRRGVHPGGGGIPDGRLAQWVSAETIVSFHAHTDDEAIFTAGTMALIKWIRGNSRPP